MTEQQLTQAERKAALEADGWTLVFWEPGCLDPVPGEPGMFRQTDGLCRFEKHWRGRAHSVVGGTLEKALDLTEQEQSRISQLADPKPQVNTGPLAK
jgi:hypothetical protein